MQIALTINAKNAFPHSLNKYWKKHLHYYCVFFSHSLHRRKTIFQAS